MRKDRILKYFMFCLVVLLTFALLYNRRTSEASESKYEVDLKVLKTQLQERSRVIDSLDFQMTKVVVHYDSLVMIKDHEIAVASKKIRKYEKEYLIVNRISMYAVADSITEYYRKRK